MAIRIKKPVSDISAIPVLPSSKSITNRLLIIKALSKNSFDIERASTSDDSVCLKKILDDFKTTSGEINKTYNCGDAGTTFRFLTAFFALQSHYPVLGAGLNYPPLEGAGGGHSVTLTGSARMQNRPIAALVDSLKAIGINISYSNKEGFPPIIIKFSDNEIKNVINIDGSISSQFISGLLMIAPIFPDGLILNISGEVVSKPYIEMTIRLMEKFGINVLWENNRITIANQEYKTENIKVEADWSAASYWYEIAALSEHALITLGKLNGESIQGDRVIADIMEKFGVFTTFFADAIFIAKENITLPDSFEYDFTDCPDLAQTVIVTCAALGIKGKFTGLGTLKYKETDRLSALSNELKKFGITTEIQNGECLLISGKINSTEEIISTYGDHRMAMAFAPVALKVEQLILEDGEVVSKSYPDFWEEIAKAGFSINQNFVPS